MTGLDKANAWLSTAGDMILEPLLRCSPPQWKSKWLRMLYVLTWPVSVVLRWTLVATAAILLCVAAIGMSVFYSLQNVWRGEGGSCNR